MRSIGMWFLAVSSLVLTTSCNQPPGVDINAEAGVIRGLSRGWLAADEARDVERAVSFYADDAVELASNTPIVEGKEAIRRWYQSWLPDTTTAISFSTDTVVVAASGELAWERGTYRFTTSTPQGRNQDTGNYLTVWKKVGTTWKVAADMATSDRPLPG